LTPRHDAKRGNYLLIGGFLMWVITVYSNSNITMFEFDTEKEAREAFKNIQGDKILSEVVYFNDPCFDVKAV
jgi:ArsR family metal-binding transcriptional regulator